MYMGHSSQESHHYAFKWISKVRYFVPFRKSLRHASVFTAESIAMVTRNHLLPHQMASNWGGLRFCSGGLRSQWVSRQNSLCSDQCPLWWLHARVKRHRSTLWVEGASLSLPFTKAYCTVSESHFTFTQTCLTRTEDAFARQQFPQQNTVTIWKSKGS